MKRIALINPNSPFLIIDGDRPPLNLAYLANQIKDKHEVRIFDFAAENPEILLKEILNYKPEIIGFTAVTPTFSIAVELLNRIKAIAEFKFVSVIGGVHATVLADSCLKYFDYVIKGEADFSFADFCDSLPEKGIVESKFITDINELLPARELLLMQKYNMQLDGKKCTTIITSRGCPYNCVFCSAISGNKVRTNSAKNVVDEIEFVINKYSINNFYFLDDVFTFDKQRVLDICRIVKERELNIRFRVTTRINLVNRFVLEALRDIGCDMICYGLESGSDRMLQIYNKKFTVADIRDVVAITKQVGIPIKAFWITSKFESSEEKKATLNLMQELDLKQNDLYNLVVYPGSKLWREKHGDNQNFTADYFENYYHGGKK